MKLSKSKDSAYAQTRDGYRLSLAEEPRVYSSRIYTYINICTHMYIKMSTAYYAFLLTISNTGHVYVQEIVNHERENGDF